MHPGMVNPHYLNDNNSFKLKALLRNCLANFIYNTDALRFLRAIKQRKRAFVLMYHRVIEDLSQEPIFVQPGMYVSQDSFRRQLSFLKTQFHILHLPELLDRIASGTSVHNCCAVSLDDGWQDNYANAFPILKQLNVPATIFLATGFIGTKRFFWPEEVAFLVAQPEVRETCFENKAFTKFLANFGIQVDKDIELDTLIAALKHLPPGKREEILAYLRSYNKTAFPRPLLMNWDEATKMLTSGLVCFGAHTHGHVILDQVSNSQAEQEIVESYNALVDHLNIAPELFAYPNGNFTDSLPSILHRNGFKAAVTTRKGWLGSKTNLYKIPRIGMHEDVSRSVPLFYTRILFDRF